VIDPACGSGIFCVSAFERLIDQNKKIKFGISLAVELKKKKAKSSKSVDKELAYLS
jgi:hypothetical protein